MRIRLLREAGGVGDVLCALGCATAIKRVRPDAHVSFYTLHEYRELVLLCRDVDRYVGVDYNTRRDRDADPNPKRWRYLRDGVWDATVDLYCPGWTHEWGTQGDVTKGRGQLFCERASEVTGLDLVPTPPRMRDDVYESGRADGWLMGKAAWPDRLMIGIQPQANLFARMWPESKWALLVGMLRERLPGVQIVCFGTHKRTRILAGYLGAVPAIYLPFPLASAILRKCSVLVGIDSGFYHLAAALGVPAVGIFGLTGGESTSAVYPKAVWIEAGTAERQRASVSCIRHCYNMPSAGKDLKRCDGAPCPAMAEISVEKVMAATLSRLAV